MDKIILGIGTPVSDYLMNVDKLPESNEGAMLLDHSWQYGGKIATAMAALGRLGVPCYMMGVVGDDINGHAHINDFQFNGVNTDYIIIDKNMETVSCVVISDRQTGGRSILMCPRRRSNREIDYLNIEAIQKTSILHLDSGKKLCIKAAETARKNGATVVFDADGFDIKTEEMLPLIDVFIPSEFYYKKCYGSRDPMECCIEMSSKGPHTVIITLGEKGCVGISHGREFTLPAFEVNVVDSTGAGDVFHGAYIYGLAKCWDAEQSAIWASATAAIKCMAMGGRAALPTADVVERFIKTGKIDNGYINERVKRYGKMPSEQIDMMD